MNTGAQRPGTWGGGQGGLLSGSAAHHQFPLSMGAYRFKLSKMTLKWRKLQFLSGTSHMWPKVTVVES